MFGVIKKICYEDYDNINAKPKITILGDDKFEYTTFPTYYSLPTNILKYKNINIDSLIITNTNKHGKIIKIYETLPRGAVKVQVLHNDDNIQEYYIDKVQSINKFKFI